MNKVEFKQLKSRSIANQALYNYKSAIKGGFVPGSPMSWLEGAMDDAMTMDVDFFPTVARKHFSKLVKMERELNLIPRTS